jgi:hypothetical protein
MLDGFGREGKALVKLGQWWKRRSGKAKAITVLAVMLSLQIGLCFSTPQLTYRSGASIPAGFDTPMWTLNLMIWQAAFCAVSAVLLALIGILGLPKILSHRAGRKEDSHD